MTPQTIAISRKSKGRLDLSKRPRITCWWIKFGDRPPAQRVSHMSKIKRQDYWKGKGGFAGIPRRVIDHDDYKSLSGTSVKLLLEFSRQYKGWNNGDLSCEWSKMKAVGFNSANTVTRARDELLIKGWIELTRVGMAGVKGRRLCNLYALTFQAIDDLVEKDGKPKLDVKSTRLPSRRL